MRDSSSDSADIQMFRALERECELFINTQLSEGKSLLDIAKMLLAENKYSKIGENDEY